MSTPSILSLLPSRDGQPVLPLGDIRIERKLKEGQLSEAFLAHYADLDIPVVLRVMKPGIKQELGEQAIAELVACCRQFGRVRHSSLTALFAVGGYKEYGYTVIEYVSGVPLNERIKERPLTEAQALKLMYPVADALNALWKTDFVHRGVSPLRIIIDNDGIPKLDFVILPRTPLKPLLVEAHAPFMAGFWPPEELKQSSEIDSRSDMFSFGASLYYAVTGRSPFGKGSRIELIAKTLTETPISARTLVPELSPELDDFLMRCLQREPKDRFDSTQSFLEELLGLKLKFCRMPTPRPSTFAPVVIDEDETVRTPAIEIGVTIGQCKLEKMVGSGAFGVVYKGRHQLLDMPVAVKFLPVDLAAKNPGYVDLFLREARTAIRIRHKHIIGLYEAGNQQGQYYLIMEFAPGGSVQDRADIMEGRLPWREVARIIQESALGLAAAEEIGIVHRDIKPANLMFGAQHEIKIADLGLAKRMPRKEGKDGAIKASIQAEQLTMKRGESVIQGTPAYIAPEAALDPDAVDGRSDQYSLGVTAYQLLTGRLPFDAPDPIQVIMKHVTQPLPPLNLAKSGVPKELEGIVTRMLAKTPDERFPNASALAGALGALG